MGVCRTWIVVTSTEGSGGDLYVVETSVNIFGTEYIIQLVEVQTD